MNTHHLRVRMLTEGAVMVALAFILSLIKLAEAPSGGSVTASMLPLAFFAVRWGLKPGMTAGFAYGLMQLVFDGAYAWGWQSILLDYLLAFIPLGLAGLFRGRPWGLFMGTILGCFGRFLVHFFSGFTVYRIVAPTELMGGTYTSPVLYSLVYNGAYMLPNVVIALMMALLIHRPLRRYIVAEDLTENSAENSAGNSGTAETQ